MILIGYSGHGYVVCGILQAAGKPVTAYCDREEKLHNPFSLEYLGREQSETAMQRLKKSDFFIAIGENATREKIASSLDAASCKAINAIHPSAIIDPSAIVHPSGVMISAGVIINPLVHLGEGAICNTASIIEHECLIGNFAHIAPGAILCGNVQVGDLSFIGAGAVIRQGIKIGQNVIVGAGAVVVKDIPDNAIVKGCPAR